MSKKACSAALIAVSILAGTARAEETPATPPPPSGETTTPPAPEQPNAQAAEADDQKVVCRKEEALTGSRIGARKICRTVAEWRRTSEAAKDTTQEIQTKDTRGPPGS